MFQGSALGLRGLRPPPSFQGLQETVIVPLVNLCSLLRVRLKSTRTGTAISEHRLIYEISMIFHICRRLRKFLTKFCRRI